MIISKDDNKKKTYQKVIIRLINTVYLQFQLTNRYYATTIQQYLTI